MLGLAGDRISTRERGASSLTLWVAILVCLLTSVANAVEPDPAAAESVRQQRLEQMKGLIDEVSLGTDDPSPLELKRLDRPILRYTNPLTDSIEEGALFLWMAGKRPVAAVSPSFRGTTIFWELSSLSDTPLKLIRNGVVVWQPPSSSRKSEKFAEAPVPAPAAAGRLVQMRALARRFQVRELRREQWQEGRLLSQPLHRWEDSSSGVIDGALFGYAETTDPELLLVIEARQESDAKQATWHFVLAKMTSSPMTVNLDEKQIWSVDGYWRNPRTPQDPYVEAQLGPTK
jgi:hypothetical protein